MIDREREQDPKLAFLRERYAFETWAEAGTPPESLFVWKYFLIAEDLPGYQPDRIEKIGEAEGRQASIRSMWRSESEPDALLEVLVFECPDRTSARVALLLILGEFQAFLKRRDGLGDIAFAAAGDGAVALALANLAVILRTADGKPSQVTEVAQHLEGNLRALPKPGGKVVPEIELLAAGVSRPDGTISISLKAADPLGRPLWFKVFGRGGEAVDRDGESAFRPYGPEPWDLTVFAINESGHSASKHFVLTER